MQSIAILSAKGIGDALLMMISANQFFEKGYKVDFYHPLADIIAPLFPNIHCVPYPSCTSLTEILHSYSCVILQNDHSNRAFLLFEQRRIGNLENLIAYFPKRSPHKEPCDFLFDQKKSMVMNIASATKELLGLPKERTGNGICISCNHIYKHCPRRVLIHPTSGNEKKNWSLEKYKKLANKITLSGFDPQFIMSDYEAEILKEKLEAFSMISFSSLLDMANYIYESGFFIGNDSGLGHLASNMNIPTITIAGNAKQIMLWHPDWFFNYTITPSFPLLNCKGIGLDIRDRYWQKFVGVSQVMKSFKKINLCTR